MLTKDFWYDLPKQNIAQEPARPRDSSKLLVLDCGKRIMEDKIFTDLGDYLQAGDLLVVNDSKVFKARLEAKKGETIFEIFLLRPDGELWLTLARPGKKLSVGDRVVFAEGTDAVVKTKNSDGTILLEFNLSHEKVFALADKHGDIPTPPYVTTAPDDFADYQTVYAKNVGSAAAPTAGFHFTDSLIKQLKDQGVNFAFVTLHVGLGTFRPVMTEKIEEHKMHEEWIDVPEETVRAIKETKERGGKVIAVGTTSVRSLESAARKLPEQSSCSAYSGFTNLFLKPGDEFKVVDAMITNFHLPESTLIMLVCAFAQSKMQTPDSGRQFILEAYKHAIESGYRFYSFGDAMLIKQKTL